ncbi:MAG: hypothetical protein H0T89_01025 [Deltaproteobacteria bacterium]|nr:hypothetical protein [Deltaproteobacteria bacterium]
MSLAEDLLAQAKHLAELERRRPKQASLRRAISTAYYSMFHLLVDEATMLVVPTAALRAAAARSFDHKALKNAAKLVGGAYRGQANWLGAYMRGSISDELAGVCDAFVELQDQRLTADYDTSVSFTRAQVSSRVGATVWTHAEWRHERRSYNARVFLLASAGLLRSRDGR